MSIPLFQAVPVDNSWGNGRAPLLPTTLRQLWAEEVLPDWVVNDLGLPSDSRMGALGCIPLPPPSHAAQRIQRFLANLIGGRGDAIRGIAIIGKPWPIDLRFDAVPWRRRTQNVLLTQRLDGRPQEIPYLTFGEVATFRQFGTLSTLDLVCTLEAAMAFFAQRDEATDVPDVDCHAPEIRSDDPSQNSGADRRVSDLLIEALGEPWADAVSEQDLRFKGLFPAGRGTIAERIDSLTASPDTRLEELATLAHAVPDIRARIEALSRQPLDLALSEYVAATAKVENLRLKGLLSRLHLGGSATPVTLEEAGAIAGVTRERMRQLQSRFTDSRPTHPVILPQLDRAIARLAEAAPISVTAASKLLIEEGWTSRPFHPASVIAAAELFRRHTTLEIHQIKDVATLVRSSASPHINAVLRAAARASSWTGASNALEVASILNSSHGIEMTDVEVRETLSTYSNAEFLEGDWFWHPDQANDPIRSVARRVLAVTSPVSVASIREGLRRHFKFRQSLARKKGRVLVAPPRDVLGAYFRAHSDFVVLDDGSVRPIRPLDYRLELGGVERAMVDIFRAASAPVLDRATLGEEAKQRGANTSSLWTMLSYSPIIDHIGTGLWTLRGARIDPAVVESIRRDKAMKPREKRVVDYGWASDGHLWIAVRVPAAADSNVLTIPSGVSRFLLGRDFVAFDEEETPCGTVRVYSSGHSGGYVPFLRRSGADEGDILLARFYLQRGTVTLSLTDDDELEELSPQL